MKKRIFKNLLITLMTVAMVFANFGTISVDASEEDSNESNTGMNDLEMVYVQEPWEEMDENTISIQNYNVMERSFDGTIEMSGIASYSNDDAEIQNTDPNYAYLVENEDIVQGVLTKESEMRWFAFILEQSSKVSIMLQTVSDVDADLYLFELDQETYDLNLIGGSATSGFGVSEYSNVILDAGIYYLAVSAYEGNGQYAFAFYATHNIDYEINDTLTDAAVVSVNSTINGVVDTPYDVDFYTFTLTSPAILKMTASVGDYVFGIMNTNDSGGIYKISEVEDMYQFDAGTYCFMVRSNDGSYNVDNVYTIVLNKIADIADNPNSFYYMVNEKVNIVFQSDPYGGNMYVNGNPIDISYSYYANASTSVGLQVYDITMSTPSDLRAKIFQDQFMFDDLETTSSMGMTMPNTVYYMGGSKGVGPTGNMLELSVYSSNPFYKIHCTCTGAYAENYMYNDLNYVTVFIDPNTGKLVDIQNLNYFYDYAVGSNSMTFTAPYRSYAKYYYPYYNGEEPLTW